MGTRTLLTAEEFDNYPFEEDKRYELDEGEMIEMTRPAYDHNRIVINLTFFLQVYFRSNQSGETLNSENLFALSPATRRSPDISVILGNRRKELRGAKVISIIPDIAVEVLSPSETPRMIHRKLTQYFEAGIKQVWIIDQPSRTVEIWNGPALPDRALGEDELLQSALLPDFQVEVAELFR